MAHVRISPFAAFPNRQTTITAVDREVLHPLTLVLVDPKGGRAALCDVRQQINFKRVSDDIAEKLSVMGFRVGEPIGPDNPARVQIVEDEDEARALEAHDCQFITDNARNGVVTPDIISKNYRPRAQPRIRNQPMVAAE